MSVNSSIVAEYLAALGRAHTYHPLRNLYVVFGFLWGCTFPAFMLLAHINDAGVGLDLRAAFTQHPIQYVLLSFPLLFAVVFGAMGTIRHDKDSALEQSIAGLEAAVAARTQDLQRTNQQAVLALSRAIEAKDPYTHGHSTRVWLFAKRAAKQLGLSDDDMEMLRLACYLHDVGKIRIPGRILNKAGPLSAEEWRIVQFHPVHSERIVAPIQAFRDVSKLIRQHHERVDGKGYPDGLSGEQIPLLARIMCVADTMDAMTSTRPYRRALDGEVAVEELKRCSGLPFDPALVPKQRTDSCGQFDPEVVQALLMALETDPLIDPYDDTPSAEDVVVRAFIDADDRKTAS